MNVIRQRLLKDCEKLIIDQIDITTIGDLMYENEVIDSSEYLTLLEIQNTADQNRRLFDYLTEKTDHQYDEFVQIVTPYYQQLSDALKNTHNVQRDIFEKALLLGDIPPRPPHYVARKKPESKLRKSIERLQRGDCLVVHGFPGYGKTSSVIETIRDENLIVNQFDGQVYMINVSDANKPDLFLLHLMKLCHKLYVNDFPSGNVLKHGLESPIFTCFREQISNLKSDQWPSEATTKATIETVRTMLRSYFAQSNALFILDDVRNGDVVDAFNFGCRMIVTTRYKNHVDRKIFTRCEFLEFTDGFIEPETLELFAMCLGSDRLRGLENDAKQIHYLCKGYPILLALIGSFLDDKPDVRPRMSFYIDKLKLNKFDLTNGYFTKICNCLIEDLNKDELDCYSTLAIFMEDVDIPARVLQIFWSKSPTDVEQIMTRLRRKTLVMSMYNERTQSYHYRIHDLLSEYLKKKVTPQKLIELHQTLVKRYSGRCRNDFSRLPNDGYIFSFLGYHLHEAKMFGEFPKVYLDLAFVGAKIKASGCTDLQIDFNLYRAFITKNNNIYLKSYLEEIERFLFLRGQDLEFNPHVDVVQCGIDFYEVSGSHYGEVYRQAKILARKKPDKLYFQLHTQQKRPPFDGYISMPSTVSYVLLLPDKLYLLGMESGRMILYSETGSLINYSEFEGHTSAIKLIICHPNDKEILTIATNGDAKLWTLTSIKDTLTMNRRNSFGTDRITCSVSPIDAFHLDFDRIINAAFSHHIYDRDVMLMLTTQSGFVRIINHATRSKVDEFFIGDPRNDPRAIESCAFSVDNQHLFLASRGAISIYKIDNNDPLITKKEDPSAQVLLIGAPTIDKREHLVIVTSKYISTCVLDFTSANVFTQAQVFAKQTTGDFSAGVLSANGLFLITASSGFLVQIWSVTNGQVLMEWHENSGLITNIDLVMPDDDVITLLYGCDKSVKKLTFNTSKLPTENAVKLENVFAARYNALMNSAYLPIIAAVDTKNHLHVYFATDRQEKLTVKFLNTLHVRQIALGADKLKVLVAFEERQSNDTNGLSNVDDLNHFGGDFTRRLNRMQESYDSLTSSNDSGIRTMTDNTPGYDTFDGRVHDSSSLIGSGELIDVKFDQLVIDDESQKIQIIECDLSALRSISSDTFKTHHIEVYAPIDTLKYVKLHNHNQSNQIDLDKIDEMKEMILVTSGNKIYVGDVSFKMFTCNHRTLKRACRILTCFEFDGRLVSIDGNRCVRVWDVFDESENNYETLLTAEDTFTIKAHAHAGPLLGFVTGDYFLIYELTQTKPYDLRANLITNTKLPTNMIGSACCFSGDGLLFAIGLESGGVHLWSLKHNEFLEPLPSVHSGAVHNLIFSPFTQPTVLVSQNLNEIAWWCVSSRCNDLETRIKRRNRGGARFHKLSNHNTSVAVEKNDFWTGKCEKVDGSGLLAYRKLHGICARNLVAKNDFSSFVTVDDTGSIYLMSVITPD